jgi:hypothetical protein
MITQSIFSNYLSPYREAGLLPEVDQSKPSEIYAQLRIAYNQGSVGVLNTTRMIAPFTDSEDDDVLYELWRNKEFQEWLQWVNKNITFKIGEASYQTLGVKLRIAVNKLDKLDLPWKVGMKVHYYLCQNTWNEQRLVINEDLPF